MLYREYKVPAEVCTGKLLWIWGVYAFAMSWLWSALTAAGFSAGVIWTLAALIGAGVHLAIREI